MADSAHNSNTRRSGRSFRLVCPTHQIFVTPSHSTSTRDTSFSTETRSCEDERADQMVTNTTSFSQNFPVTRTSSTSVQTRNKTDMMSQTEESQPPAQRTVIIQRCQSAQVQLDEPSPNPEQPTLPVDEVRLFVRSQVCAFLDQLPSKRLDLWDQTKPGQCSVCFEDYQPGHIVMTLPCFHVLHEDCARRWFEGCFNCPICRTCILNWD
ncbi:hypothetical protein D915_004855 [Fasciola hepatica]|uniref:RING-type domain-containing protein n=1 Tax=Fasciola hepatica TaxID=6192 RepID=A0A4E0RDL3_FASHE|nr:hypothetical protein D915_004855 [Fasciola hepatica]